MVSKLAKIKEIILQVLSDENEHTTDDFVKSIMNAGIDFSTRSSVVRTAIYQLRNSGIDIFSRDRGIYQLKKNCVAESNRLLKDFETIIPAQKCIPKCMYIHENGKISMGGRLNAEIKTRQIEIRISYDTKRIALIPNGEHAHIFTKNGVTKNEDLIRIMKKSHVVLPATFVMKIDKESGIWIGEIQKDIKAPSRKRFASCSK